MHSATKSRRILGFYKLLSKKPRLTRTSLTDKLCEIKTVVRSTKLFFFSLLKPTMIDLSQMLVIGSSGENMRGISVVDLF